MDSLGLVVLGALLALLMDRAHAALRQALTMRTERLDAIEAGARELRETYLDLPDRVESLETKVSEIQLGTHLGGRR